MKNSLMKRIPLVITGILLVIMLASACSAAAPARNELTSPSVTTAPSTTAPVQKFGVTSGSGVPPAPEASSGGKATSPSSRDSRSDTIGLAAGGAKDINNFRENIKEGYLPVPTDVTYEGLFYDYYFETGQTEKCRKLFCPSYSYAVTRDPFSEETEYYLSVGLNSGMKESDFERKKLNLMVVLDVSGSMSSPFDEYYYDGTGQLIRLERSELNMAKMEVAKDALRSVIDQLDYDDRFGIVLFNSRAYSFQKISSMEGIDFDELSYDIDRIRANGSTNIADGMIMATEQLNKYRKADAYEYENRIIFLTDAMPNTGETGEYSLLNMLKKNASNHIYTTFIGIGVDFNSELVEYITKIKGANYYSVHSPRQFEQRVEEEFDYMVTPLVFDLRLTLDGAGWFIDAVYGSPEADKSTGEIMKVNTLFPSKKQDGETKGGLILLKLKKGLFAGDRVTLNVTYEDRDGRRDSSEATVYLENTGPEYFDNTGIRKGVLLARYADLVKNWMVDEHDHMHWSLPWDPRIDYESGIVLPPENLGFWERQSLPLTVSPEYRSLFRDFSRYFEDEMDEIGDYSLEQELFILDKLNGYRD